MGGVEWSEGGVEVEQEGRWSRESVERKKGEKESE